MRPVADAAKVRAFMREIGKRASAPARIYLVGGSSAVLQGWRPSTVDVDVRIVPDTEILGFLPGIKRDLNLNVELAAPDEFIPPLPGWEARSPWIAREGKVDFFHYDFYAQALAKLERGIGPDRDDVRHMIDAGLVAPAEALRLFGLIEPELYRYPALDPGSFRRAVEAAFGPQP
jgi:hypothetical protein